MTVPPEILEAYGLEPATIERAPTGLIHQTHFLDRRLVAQRMHPVFGAEVLADIEAVTARLADVGLATPRLVRTRDGERGARDAAGNLWRVLTYLDGYTMDELSGPPAAAEAGRLVARFHRALHGAGIHIQHARAAVHDTPAHLARLERVAAGALGDAILAEARHLEPTPDLPRRLVHGDLKLSNVLYRDGQAIALLDLDTVGWLPLMHELGDAWRSWCNPNGESNEEARFDLDMFAAAAGGYAAEAGAWVTADEIASLVPGVHAVAVELAARFCVDMVEDRYFGWDAARFPSRPEHNRVRATGQLSLARQVRAARAAAGAAVTSAFACRPSAPP